MTYQEAKALADEAWKVYERNPTRENMAHYSTLADRADDERHERKLRGAI